MVVLSAVVLTESGKTLLARQYVSMTRLRIEGLIAAFPKLVETGSQHTYIETDSVRYVYQRMDQLFVLLITNKHSNIIEDIDTLRIIAKLIPEYCQGHTEDAVAQNVFELVHAFDEVLSLGYKEPVEIDSIRKYTEMDSHEERMAKMVMETKVTEAREAMLQRAKKIDKDKEEHRRFESMAGRGGGSRGGGGGFGSDSYSTSSMGGGYGGSDYRSESMTSVKDTPIRAPKPSGARKTGLVLGKAKPKDDFLKKVQEQEQKAVPRALQSSLHEQHHEDLDDYDTERPSEPVVIVVQEQVTVEMERDGALKTMSIKGSLIPQISDPEYSHITIHTQVDGAMEGITFRPHANMDRNAWRQDNTLQLKSSSGTGFPIGSNQKRSILVWRAKTSDADQSPPPLSFTCWPSEEDGEMVVSCEYEMLRTDLTLRNVLIHIPIPDLGGERPNVSHADGETSFHAGVLQWRIAEICTSQTGSLDFSLPGVDSDEELFPIAISFKSQDTFSGLTVASIKTSDGEDVDFATVSSLEVDKFVVE